MNYSRIAQMALIVVGAFIVNGFSQNRPFPQNEVIHGYIAKSISNDDVRAVYELWKRNYLKPAPVVSGGYRVEFNSPAGTTVSEGQAYGMLLTAYYGERSYFDGFYKFYLQSRNVNGLMRWKVYDDGRYFFGGNDAYSTATDADEDVILALLVAYDQWNHQYYKDEAIRLANILGGSKYVIESNGKLIMIGGEWGDANFDTYAPDYQSPAWFRVYAENGADPMWSRLADDLYAVIDRHQSRYNTVIVADFAQAGTGIAGRGTGGGDKYQYDACRAPWRIGMDYIWHGSPLAKAYALRFTEFARTKGFNNIKDCYNLDGSACNDWENAAFTGAFAVSAAASSQADVDALALETKNLTYDNYYITSLKAIYMLAMTGNMWRPGNTTVNEGPFTIATSVEGPGNVVVAPQALEYEKGSEVILTATPDEGMVFVGWTGDVSGTQNPLQLTVYRNQNVSAVFRDPSAVQELLDNPSFDQGDQSWTLQNFEGGASTANWQDSLGVTITASGSTSWHVQLIQTNLNLLPNTQYILKVRVRGEGINKVDLSMTNPNASYSQYAGTALDIDESWQEFTLSINSGSGGEARVEVNMGNAGTGVVWLDDFSLMEKIDTPVAAIRKSDAQKTPQQGVKLEMRDGMLLIRKTGQSGYFTLQGQRIFFE